jgi:hypothetical protein
MLKTAPGLMPIRSVHSLDKSSVFELLQMKLGVFFVESGLAIMHTEKKILSK